MSKLERCGQTQHSVTLACICAVGLCVESHSRTPLLVMMIVTGGVSLLHMGLDWLIALEERKFGGNHD